MRPFKERLLIAMWVVVLLWCLGATAISIGYGEDQAIALAIFLSAIALLPAIILQYLIVGHADVGRLFRGQSER